LSEENRFGTAVGLLMDAVTLLNNQGEVAKRINDFIATVHPLECGPMAITDRAGLLVALKEFVRIDDEDTHGLMAGDGSDLVLALDDARKAIAAAEQTEQCGEAMSQDQVNDKSE